MESSAASASVPGASELQQGSLRASPSATSPFTSIAEDDAAAALPAIPVVATFAQTEQRIQVRAGVDTNAKASDTESVTSLSSNNIDNERDEKDAEDEEDGVEEKLLDNQDTLDVRKKDWTIVESGGSLLIKSPMASRLDQLVMNPYTYHNLRPLNSLKEFATLIGAPSDWKDRLRGVYESTYVRNAYNTLRRPDLSSNREENVAAKFSMLVGTIGYQLNCTILPNGGDYVRVGGVLAHPGYDYRSRTDHRFTTVGGETIFSTEAKTTVSFPIGHAWHRSSRGVQTLAALYGFNRPTILYSSARWKLFVENSQRDAVFTYPVAATGSENAFQYVLRGFMAYIDDKALIDAIGICILATSNQKCLKQASLESDQGISGVSDGPTESKQTPLKPQRPRRGKSDKGNNADGDESGKGRSGGGRQRPVQPKFFSGYSEDGQPLWITVRVEVEQAEDVEKELSELVKEKVVHNVAADSCDTLIE